MNSIKTRLITMAAVALAVTACGGGGGDGDSQAGVTPPPTGSSKTRIVTGAISGFGSIIVNGVRYDTSSADVRVDDNPGSLADLAVGQVVRIGPRWTTAAVHARCTSSSTGCCRAPCRPWTRPPARSRSAG